MAREFAAAFYSSPAWKKTREAYRASVGNLCERCYAAGQIVPGEIVHHRNPLTPENINDPDIALGFGNLELLCRECHEAMHEDPGKRKRYRVDESGRVIVYHPPV